VEQYGISRASFAAVLLQQILPILVLHIRGVRVDLDRHTKCSLFGSRVDGAVMPVLVEESMPHRLRLRQGSGCRVGDGKALTFASYVGSIPTVGPIAHAAIAIQTGFECDVGRR
jgi:hypothetical protein